MIINGKDFEQTPIEIKSSEYYKGQTKEQLDQTLFSSLRQICTAMLHSRVNLATLVINMDALQSQFGK